MDNKVYNVAVVGAGAGGLTVAISMARLGKSVLLIEQDKVGGECTHSGCIPSKSLLYAAKQNYSTEDALAYAQAKIQEIYQHESPDLLEEMGITYQKGVATFSSPRTVCVHEHTYSFRKAVIATGSVPRTITIPGLEDNLILSNQNIFNQTRVPARLLVIGSGPVGLELSQAAARMGSQVTLVTHEKKLGSRYHAEVSRIISRSCDHHGIRVFTDAQIERVAKNTACVHRSRSSTPTLIEFDKILMAIGRQANIPSGLEQAHVQSTQQGITVNHNYQTTNKHIYAIGDVSSDTKFTHMANHAGRAVVKHIVSKRWLATKQPAVPRVIYTDPEIAQVGLSYQQAVREFGEDNVVVSIQNVSSLDRAVTDNIPEGVCVVTSKRLSGKIVGAEIASAYAGELLASFTLAIEHNISMWKLSRTVYPYPTLSEIVKKTADQFVLQTLGNIRNELSYLVKKHAPKAIALVFWLGMFATVLGVKNAQGLSNTDLVRMLYDFMTTSVWGPCIYILVYVLRPLIFFPATVLTALSGALFGLPLGILLTIIGENGSANLAYWIGRFFGNGIRLEHNNFIGPYVSRAQKHPFTTVLLMRFLYLPFDLTNYASGIMRIRWSAYFAATLVGILPGLITFVALGASLDINTIITAVETGSIASLASGINLAVFAGSVGLFAASLVLARYVTKYVRHEQ